jgi:hypothetical protein
VSPHDEQQDERFAVPVAEPISGDYRPIVVRRVVVKRVVVRRAFACLVVGAAVLAGCGTDDDGDQTTTETTPAPEPQTELTVELDSGDGAAADEWTLTCDPAGGTHPDTEAACATLAELDPEVFEPVPADAACTMIHGGPQTATVTGQWNGEPVEAQFSRENGCEIDRWDQAAPVLGSEGGVSAPSS